MEVTLVCCPEQWCHAILPRLQIHLRSLHHSLHNIQFSIFTDLKKYVIMGDVLGFYIFSQGFSQVQHPARKSMFLAKSTQRSAYLGVNTSNSKPVQ